MAPAHGSREAQQHAIGGIGEHTIRETGDRVGIVEHQRPRGRKPRERTRHGRESAEAEHDVRRAATDDPAALPAGADEREWTEYRGLPSLAPDAAERHALELDTMPAHERSLHAVARSEPEHAPAARHELRRHGESGKDVAPVPPAVIMTVPVPS